MRKEYKKEKTSKHNIKDCKSIVISEGQKGK